MNPVLPAPEAVPRQPVVVRNPSERKARQRSGMPALELIESAVHLLRSAPPAALLAYYAGSVPCMFGLFYFWADMSGGTFAREHLLWASLAAALLYIWMKVWQTVFCSRLHSHLVGAREVPWTWSRVARLVAIQAAVQPSGLFTRCFAAQILVPYVWVYAFYQNVGVLGDGAQPGIRRVMREAFRQARLWPRQAHSAVGCLFGFGFFVWLNVCLCFAVAPSLLSTFFGIETIFSRNMVAMLNTTTFAATLAVTYLCFDPIRKAVFVLRCFHGASLRSGEDLRVALRTWTMASRLGLALLLVGAALLGSISTAGAAEATPPRLAPTELNESMDRVLQRPEFAWRLPRADRAGEKDQANWLAAFFHEMNEKAQQVMRQLEKQLHKLGKWLRKWWHRKPHSEDTDGGGGFGWLSTAQMILLALVAALVVILALLVWRARKERATAIAFAQAAAPSPDLNREDVSADQLPEDGWLRLARDLMEKSEWRLALRAFYLATLAHLGGRAFIQLARHKSNRDYDRELQRRARAHPGLLEAFDENLAVFERAWYGEHAVNAGTIESFSQNLERMRGC